MPYRRCAFEMSGRSHFSPDSALLLASSNFILISLAYIVSNMKKYNMHITKIHGGWFKQKQKKNKKKTGSPLAEVNYNHVLQSECGSG